MICLREVNEKIRCAILQPPHGRPGPSKDAILNPISMASCTDFFWGKSQNESSSSALNGYPDCQSVGPNPPKYHETLVIRHDNKIRYPSLIKHTETQFVDVNPIKPPFYSRLPLARLNTVLGIPILGPIHILSTKTEHSTRLASCEEQIGSLSWETIHGWIFCITVPFSAWSFNTQTKNPKPQHQ